MSAAASVSALKGHADRQKPWTRLPLFPTDAPGGIRQPTKVSFLHMLQEFVPVQVLEFDKTVLCLHGNETDGAWFENEARSKWKYAATARNSPIVVLGTSCTSGSGANESTDPDIRASSVQLSQISNVRNSWARHFVDFLNRHLVHHGLEPISHLDIFAKNAVSPANFASCTGSFVPSSTRIVIVEVVTNLFTASSLAIYMGSLVAAVRREAPNAAVVFVEWPTSNLVQNADRLALLKAYSSFAKQHHVDLLRADLVLQKLVRPCSAGYNSTGNANDRPCYLQLYARRSADPIHPNPWGHQLLGGLVARYVAKSLLLAAEGSDPHGELTQSSGSAGWSAGSAGSGSAGSAANASAKLELCYQSANNLPVASKHSRGDWRLVDEGAAKGVSKLGLLSTRLDDVLSLDISKDLPDHIRSICGLLRVKLNYLLSTTIPTQGSIYIFCQGCTCAQPAQPYAHGLYPFPWVETNANFANDAQFRNSNLSVSSQTAFLVLHTHKPCYVNLRHVASKSTQAENRRNDSHSVNFSRVRVDALFVERLDQEAIRYFMRPLAARSPAGRLLRRAQKMNCSEAWP